MCYRPSVLLVRCQLLAKVIREVSCLLNNFLSQVPIVYLNEFHWNFHSGVICLWRNAPSNGIETFRGRLDTEEQRVEIRIFRSKNRKVSAVSQRLMPTISSRARNTNTSLLLRWYRVRIEGQVRILHYARIMLASLRLPSFVPWIKSLPLQPAYVSHLHKLLSHLYRYRTYVVTSYQAYSLGEFIYGDFVCLAICIITGYRSC